MSSILDRLPDAPPDDVPVLPWLAGPPVPTIVRTDYVVRPDGFDTWSPICAESVGAIPELVGRDDLIACADYDLAVARGREITGLGSTGLGSTGLVPVPSGGSTTLVVGVPRPVPSGILVPPGSGSPEPSGPAGSLGSPGSPESPVDAGGGGGDSPAIVALPFSACGLVLALVLVSVLSRRRRP